MACIQNRMYPRKPFGFNPVIEIYIQAPNSLFSYQIIVTNVSITIVSTLYAV